MSIQRNVVLVVALAGVPQLSVAQTRDWEDLANQISRQVEQQVDQIARNVERQADQVARYMERRFDAQGGRGRGRGFGRGPEYTEAFSRTVRLGRNGTFDLQNVSGDITITGGGGDDVRIDATKRVRHPNEAEAKTILSEIQIQVEERGGRVDVRTEYPRGRNWAGGVDFTVAVPRDASVGLRTVSGTVKVSNVNGELRAESVSGDIITSSTRKLRMVKTVSGDLEVTDAEADEFSVSTVSGDLIVNKLKANGFDAQSVSADLRLTDVDVNHASFRSVSGDIEYVGRLQKGGRYQFQSHSGDVRVTPVDAKGFAIEASTFSGDVRSDYSLTLQGGTSNSLVGPGRNRSIRGSFGDAGATLTLQSFSGDIVIVKR